MMRKSMLLASLMLSLFCSVAQAQQSQYSIMQDDPDTGTSLKKPIISYNLPINKRYEEFTDEEKACLVQMYEHLDEGDEPPFPKDGLRKILSMLHRAREKLDPPRGTMSLVATVDANGDVTEVKSIGNYDPEMVRFTSSLFLLTKFKPAKCKGQACTMDYPFRMNFYETYLR